VLASRRVIQAAAPALFFFGPHPMSSDADLLERIKQDAPGAFEEFVTRYGERILGFGLRFCGETEDAKDVMQETLIQAWSPRATRAL
jgi:DNA-directed RNA polymerase specialized sigma24 family protein